MLEIFLNIIYKKIESIEEESLDVFIECPKF